MDYENTADNLCRVMNPHHRSPTNPGFHQQLQTSGHHPTSMMYHAQTTTTTSTVASTAAITSNAYSSPMTDGSLQANNHQNLMSPNGYKSSNHYDDESTLSTEHDTSTTESVNYPAQATMNANNNNNNMSHTEYDDSQSVNTSLVQHQSTAHHGYYPHNQHRNWPPTNYIRTRQCDEGENFCSIVSVVRIEFVNDSLLSRFWAMER